MSVRQPWASRFVLISPRTTPKGGTGRFLRLTVGTAEISEGDAPTSFSQRNSLKSNENTGRERTKDRPFQKTVLGVFLLQKPFPRILQRSLQPPPFIAFSSSITAFRTSIACSAGWISHISEAGIEAAIIFLNKRSARGGDGFCLP